MSERLGKLTYGVPLTPQFLNTPFGAGERNYSEQTAEMIDEETRRIAEETHQRVKKILTTRRAKLERIARELMKKETLDRSELDKLLTQAGEAAVA